MSGICPNNRPLPVIEELPPLFLIYKIQFKKNLYGIKVLNSFPIPND